jgi:predicted nucleic acid-binding protein
VILVDTSAWVEYDRATGSAVDKRLAELIETNGPIAVTEPIIMEVQAGARDEVRQERLRRLLLGFRLLPFDPVVDFDGAALIYRRCRAAGINPRGLLDCMIASVGWRTKATLLAQDADLDRVAAVIGLALDGGSERPTA